MSRKIIVEEAAKRWGWGCSGYPGRKRRCATLNDTVRVYELLLLKTCELSCLYQR